MHTTSLETHDHHILPAVKTNERHIGHRMTLQLAVEQIVPSETSISN